MDDLLRGPLGAERADHAPDLIAGTRPRRRQGGWRAGVALATIALLGILGCGGGEEAPGPGAGPPMAGGGGALAYAVPRLPSSLDPLAPSTGADAIVTRQIHEPLVGELHPPYGERTPQPGLALSVRPSPDRRVWTLELRRGVGFQDGTALNASAVLANATRWRTTGAGRRLLPGLFAADSPRPHEVRLLLRRPLVDLPRRLGSHRLGIVSPQALEPRSGEGARYAGSGGTGTGPFDVGPRSDQGLDLIRNPGWWGSPLGLGPALDTIAFVAAPGEAERLALLRSGEVRVAGPQGPRSLRAAARDPLLTALGGPAGIAAEASVRGLTGDGPQSLSGVWLTTVEG